MGTLMVGANEATGPGRPLQDGVFSGGNGEVERAVVEGSVDRGGDALHNDVGVESVAPGEGGSVEDAEGGTRGEGRRRYPG